MLTKDADKLICIIYKDYLTRRKSGESKRTARDYSDKAKWPDTFYREFDGRNLYDTLIELKRAGYIRCYLDAGFAIEDAGIIYMEQRFPNGISQVLDWLSKAKSLIPFV